MVKVAPTDFAAFIETTQVADAPVHAPFQPVPDAYYFVRANGREHASIGDAGVAAVVLERVRHVEALFEGIP